MQASEPISSSNQQTSSSQTAKNSFRQSSDTSSLTQESGQGKKSNKWLIVGLRIFALVVLGTAGVFTYQSYQFKKQVEKPSPSSEAVPTKAPQLTPTNTVLIPLPTLTAGQTVGWKTYKDKANKYEIKYPQDWYILERPGPVISFSNSKSGEGKNWIVVSIFKNTDVNMNSLSSRKKYFEDKPEDYQVLGDITVDGRSGFEVEFLKNSQREAIIAGDLNEVPQDIFTVFVTYDEPQRSNAINIYQEILSTFKFLD